MVKDLPARIERFVRRHEIQKWGTNYIFYKAVTKDHDSVMYPGDVKYRPFTDVQVGYVDCDASFCCGEGLHVGTKACAVHYVQQGDADKIMRVLVHPTDIVCISDGAMTSFPADIKEHKLRVSHVFVLDSVLKRRDGKYYFEECDVNSYKERICV